MNSVLMNQEHHQVLNNKYTHPQTIQEFDSIYEHFVYYIQMESSFEVLSRFRLLIEAENYPDPKILESLTQTLRSQSNSLDFNSFFNRCCQLFISYWSQTPDNESAMFELLSLFKNLPSSHNKSDQFSQKWQQSITDFAKSAQYLKLQRLVRLINPRLVSDAPKPQYLGDLIGRYPFLYKNCLLDKDDLREYRHLLSRIRKEKQHILKQGFRRGIIFQKQRLEIARLRQVSPETLLSLRQPAKHLTLLNDKEYTIALRQFIPLTQGNLFLGYQINQLRNNLDGLSFKEFKNWFINYLLQDINELSKREQFKQFLNNKIPLIASSSDYDSKQIDEFLIQRTSHQVLNGLIGYQGQNFNYQTLVDLITDLGATQIASVIGKLLLLNPRLRNYVTSQLSELFCFHESKSISNCVGLIQFLENYLIIWSIIA
ncbi:hypothetical protein cce_4652 [Crocosphaera subtropica ATCC 51142]|uniref:Uncharacterized protein n=1 Tax=Crocosphaera subtropica (strain ATCC 51142 / BH68) TaxID=43989 RepID=B1WW72_CROS5|nr:hypothetical protein [Crocosphaera subtropica]ACB54000.1 hypothetical protein cce_4652 [Crocosphaera subtropica ATCC 51142]